MLDYFEHLSTTVQTFITASTFDQQQAGSLQSDT